MHIRILIPRKHGPFFVLLVMSYNAIICVFILLVNAMLLHNLVNVYNCLNWLYHSTSCSKMGINLGGIGI